MGTGLKDHWGVDVPAQPGSDEQSRQFKAAFQQELGAINGHLQYTAAHAEEAKHAPLASRRDTLIPAFQGALGQIDPENAGKAQGAIDRVLQDARALGAEVAAFRQSAEKAYDGWQQRQPQFDDAVHHVEELEAWEDPKAPTLRTVVATIQKQTDMRQYAPSSMALDQLLPKLDPIYQEYLKQKAAKEQYEPLLAALEPRYTAATVSKFAKLKPQQDDMAALRTDMEAAATKKDFVQALQRVNDLTGKVADYEKALAELEQQKREYEDGKAALQPRLDQAKQGSPYKKLAQQLDELGSGTTQMEQTADAEDFVGALSQARALDGKADAYNKAVAELDEQKKQYEAERAAVQPKLDQASQATKFKKLDAMLQELTAGPQQMDQAAEAEDFPGAQNIAKGLQAKADTYAQAVAELEQQKKAFEDEKALLQPKIEQADKSTKFKKLDSQFQEMTAGLPQMDQAATAEDFVGALNTAKDLGTKADTYNQAVAELERQKEEFETEKIAMEAKVNQVNQARKYQKLDPQFNEVMTGPTRIGQLAESEDFVGALNAAKEIEAKSDTYLQADAEVKKQEQEFNDEKAQLQPKLDQASQATKFKKLDAQLQQLTSGQAQMDETAKAEDFVAALSSAKELEAKADAYLQAVKDLEEQKKAYDDAAAAIQPRVAEASKVSYKKLAPAQAEIADLQTKMEASATDEDFAGALDQSKVLASKLDAFEEQLKQIEEQKRQYEDAKAQLQQKMDEVGRSTPHKKLDPQLQELTSGQAQMTQAADAEDFEGALAKAKELDGKADDYLKAVAKLEEEKKAFDEAADKVRPRIAAASQATYTKLAAAKDEIANLQTKMDAAANDEDFVGALEQANQLSSKLDDFEKTLKEIEEQKRKYEDEKPILQQKLDDAARAPQFKKLDSMLQELNAGQGQIDQLAQGEDFEGAFNAAKDLETKADAYLKAAAEADEQKKAFDKVVEEKVKPRVGGLDKSSFKKLESLQGEIKDLNSKMEASADAEDYVTALDQANQVSAKLDEYEKKVEELTAQKQKCEEARKTLQSQLDEIKQISHPKLAPLVADIDATLKQMDDALVNEDFEGAEKLGEDIKGKIENYHTAENELEAKRVAFVPAFSETLTRMEKAKGLCEQFHEKVPDSFESLRGEIESLSKAEEYDDAMKKIEEINKQLDPLEKKLQELAELKSKCDEAKKTLDPQIEEIKRASHPKLAPLLQEIDGAMKAFDDSMVIQDYQAALKSAGEVPPKIEQYKAKANEIDAKRQAYTQPSYEVLTKLKEVREKCAQSGEAMPEALEALGTEIVKLSADEEFDEGMKKIEELKKQLEDFEKKRSLTDDFSKSDEETQKVRGNIEKATTRALGYINERSGQITDAVLAFEREASSQVDKVIDDNSDTLDVVGPFVSVIGGLVCAVFPPAGAFVAGTTFVSSLVVGGIKAEEGEARQALKTWIGQYATAVSNALANGREAEKSSIPSRLNGLARTDQSVWTLLAGSFGNEESDQVMARLQIPVSARQSCYGQVLKGLMAEWGSWSAKQKAQHGKTRQQKMIDDNVPGDPSSKDVRKKMSDGKKAGAAKGSQMGKGRSE